MSDSKREIAQMVINTLKVLFTYFPGTLEPHLPKIIEKIIYNIYSKSVLVITYSLFEVIL